MSVETTKATPTSAQKNGETRSKDAPFELTELELWHLDLPIVGLSPLISHKWADKAKKQMLDKQTKVARVGKVAKVPDEDYRNSLYVFDDREGKAWYEKAVLPPSGFGFPAIAFKGAAVRAGTYAEQKMTFLRGAFHISQELVKIEGTPEMREDMVRIGMGKADIRYRGEFKHWGAILPIRFNGRAVSLDEIINLFRVAGFSVGIGEWRPEKDGSYGMFDIDRSKSIRHLRVS